MAKLGEARAPAKGDKERKASKASATSRKKSIILSQDIVVESDGGEFESGSSTGNDTDRAVELEKQQNITKDRPKTLQGTEPTDPPATDATNREQDSGSPESSETSGDDLPDEPSLKNTKVAPPKIVAVKRKAAEDGVEGISPNGRNKRSRKDEKANGPEHGEATAQNPSPEESEDEDEESDDSNVVESRDSAVPTVSRAAVSSHMSRATPAQQYNPPSGYSAVNSLNSSHHFPDSGLANKYMWHITAPLNVSFRAISDLALESIHSGESVLREKGVEYNLTEDSRSIGSTNTVLFPTKDGFRPASKEIVRTLHLQQKVSLPNSTSRQAIPETGSNAAAEVHQTSVPAIRPQPKGLRMRFRPPGFGTGEPGRIGSGSDSTDDNDDIRDPPETSAFRLPRSAAVSRDAHQRKAPEAVENGSEFSEKPAKKKRKEKKGDLDAETPSKGKAVMPSRSTPMVNGTHHRYATPSKTPYAPDPEAAGSVLTNGNTLKDIPKDAKVKQKEERMKRRKFKEGRTQSREASGKVD